MNRVVQSVRANAVAYVALFVALGGTSVAAIEIPASSVGARQLRNGAITPVKMDSSLFGGYVRAWASVSSTGHVYASHGFKAHVNTQSNSAGTFVLFPTNSKLTGCSALSSIAPAQVSGQASGPGFADASVLTPPQPHYPVSVGVSTFSAGGQPQGLPFVVEVLC